MHQAGIDPMKGTRLQVLGAAPFRVGDTYTGPGHGSSIAPLQGDSSEIAARVPGFGDRTSGRPRDFWIARER